jgi:hypothetical protein
MNFIFDNPADNENFYEIAAFTEIFSQEDFLCTD